MYYLYPDFSYFLVINNVNLYTVGIIILNLLIYKTKGGELVTLKLNTVFLAI